jgi:hypothetical protein
VFLASRQSVKKVNDGDKYAVMKMGDRGKDKKTKHKKRKTRRHVFRPLS